MSEMTVEDAEREAVEAEQLAAELEERVRSGDDGVSPEDLAEAERLGRFARLRVDAAHRKATARRRTAAIERGQAFVEELQQQTLEEDAALVAAFEDLVAALGALQAASDRRSAAVRDASDRRQGFEVLLRRDAETGLDQLGVLPSLYGGEIGYQVPAVGIRVAEVPLGRVVAAAVAVGLDASVRSSLAATVAVMEAGHVETTFGDRVVGMRETVRRLVEERRP